MKPLPLVLASCAALLVCTAAAADNAAPMVEGGPHAELFSEVQRRLTEQGFDPGPVNGSYSARMQAALAQFQRNVPLPASGQLDDPTLDALGVKRRPAEVPAPAADPAASPAT